jgi:hypothetical protein
MPRIDGTLATPLADRRRGHEMIRLMVVCNTVDSLYRPLQLALDEGYAIEFGHAAARGDRVVMLALLVNALKEAVDAFEQVIDLAEELFAYTRGEEIYLKFQTLKAEIDHKNPATIYCRLIQPIPENIAIHWDHSAAETSLTAMIGARGVLQTHHESERGRTVSRFPLADDLYQRTMLGPATAPQIRAAAKEIGEFTELFKLVTDHLIAMFLRALGCQPVEGE